MKTYDMARKAIESSYCGVCTIIERRQVRDEQTKISQQKEQVILENQPCRLSVENAAAAVQSDTAAAVGPSVKLFLAPEVELKPGSKIIVEQNGRRFEYAASGEAAAYSSHQEVYLSLWKGWA